MRGSSVVDSKTVDLTDLQTKKVTFEAISLGGREMVLITANILEDGVSAPSYTGRLVKEIQPTAENKGLTNIFYSGTAPIQEDLAASGDGHKNYESTVDIIPAAARVEIGGEVKYNQELVKGLYVDVITPSEYTNSYGDTDKFIPSQDKTGDLWLDLDTDKYLSINDPKQRVAANHLFAGDIQKIAFRLNANIYETKKDDKGSAKKVQLDDGSSSFLYVLEGSSPESEKLAVLKSDKQLYSYELNKVGEVIIGDSPLTEAKRATYNTVEKNTGFFAFVNFKSDANGSIDTGYQAGKIYQINLAQIDWNGNGDFDDEDLYNPEDNGTGTDNPAQAADLTISATVKEWTKEHVTPGIE